MLILFDQATPVPIRPYLAGHIDRKSTRLNSSHLVISYAVFCLKKNNDKSKFGAFESGYSAVGERSWKVPGGSLCATTFVPGSPGQSWHFFFNDTATTEIYTLSLHDALPI